jgi:hypothetical protein
LGGQTSQKYKQHGFPDSEFWPLYFPPILSQCLPSIIRLLPRKPQTPGHLDSFCAGALYVPSSKTSFQRSLKLRRAQTSNVFWWRSEAIRDGFNGRELRLAKDNSRYDMKMTKR